MRNVHLYQLKFSDDTDSMNVQSNGHTLTKDFKQAVFNKRKWRNWQTHQT